MGRGVGVGMGRGVEGRGGKVASQYVSVVAKYGLFQGKDPHPLCPHITPLMIQNERGIWHH
jgi:hypothetical protein